MTNVTQDQAMIGLMGPRSRALLSELTSVDLSNEDFRPGTGRSIDVAGAEVLALRMSYVGELGWELYAPNATAGTLYDALVEAGAHHGLVHAGFHAMNSLRLEAGMRHWGHDIADQDTPLEAGLGFTIAWDKPGGFRGRAALAAQRGEPRTKRLVQFRLEDPDRMTYHDEPIHRNGTFVGRTTSSMWSRSQDRCCSMGYVQHSDAITAGWLDEGTWEITVAGTRVPASASLRSWYDPANERPKM
jgi:4-methylaminobutanoate oxidase (formaldehyde-forming)